MIPEDFCERMSGDWLWREGELRNIDSLLFKPMEINIKAAILMTYAHWEGHFKLCASELLAFISEGVKRKIFQWTDVQDNIRQRILFCSYRKTSLSSQTHETFISYLNYLNDPRYSSIINAKSEIIMIDDNLNALRAEAICRNLGVDYKWIAVKKIIIDERLLEHRNAIAHGSKFLRSGDALNLKDPAIIESLRETRALIRETRDRFSNAVLDRSFLFKS